MEYVYKKHVMNANGIDPTIMNPANYRERFKLAMHTYFLSLLGDQQIESFQDVAQRQIEFKKKIAEEERELQKEKNKLLEEEEKSNVDETTEAKR